MAFDLIMPPIVGLAGLLVAFVIYNVMSKHDAGPDNVKRIADQIHVGAMVFMHREYKMLAAFAAVLVAGIFCHHWDKIRRLPSLSAPCLLPQLATWVCMLRLVPTSEPQWRLMIMGQLMR